MARAAPILAVAVVLPTPPLPEVTTIAVELIHQTPSLHAYSMAR